MPQAPEEGADVTEPEHTPESLEARLDIGEYKPPSQRALHYYRVAEDAIAALEEALERSGRQATAIEQQTVKLEQVMDERDEALEERNEWLTVAQDQKLELAEARVVLTELETIFENAGRDYGDLPVEVRRLVAETSEWQDRHFEARAENQRLRDFVQGVLDGIEAGTITCADGTITEEVAKDLLHGYEPEEGDAL